MDARWSARFVRRPRPTIKSLSPQAKMSPPTARKPATTANSMRSNREFFN
jgi:hypothetical protein